MKPGLITVANEQVSISTVCRMLGIEVPDDLGRSTKLHCPFEQVYHSDQGVDPAMRIYTETNSAYCFSCSAYYTPTSMYALGMDLRWRDAAVQLLDRVGYRPVDLRETWQRALETALPPDRAQLAEALKTYCRRVDPGWSSHQFDDVVAAMLTRCLGLLDLVTDADQAWQWLECCKKIMKLTIDA